MLSRQDQTTIARPLQFHLDGVHNRLLSDWRKGNRSWRAAARKHAAETGQAGVWRCDDSFILFYRENGTVYQRTWKHAAPTLQA